VGVWSSRSFSIGSQAGPGSAGRIAVLDVFRELRALVSGEEGKKPRPVGRSSMKTLPRTLAFVVLAVIVTLAVVSWFLTYRMVPNQKPDHQLILHIGTDTIFDTTYVYWTTEEKFDDALKQVCQDGGTYKIRKLKAEHEKAYNAKSCEQILKTVKVTKSKAADQAAVGASGANDPNVTSKVAVAVANKDDIKAVLDALVPAPTPAP
jgi:hypothetical protein